MIAAHFARVCLQWRPSIGSKPRLNFWRPYLFYARTVWRIARSRPLFGGRGNRACDTQKHSSLSLFHIQIRRLLYSPATYILQSIYERLFSPWESPPREFLFHRV